jgi:hypothetical protein
MLCPASNITPDPGPLCQPTGGGKSLVRDIFAVAHGGITWCISPLLSLAADQVTKLQQQAALSSIVAIHLDKHTRDVSKLRQLCLQLASIPKSSSLTTIVFSSPQILVDNLLVRNLFRTLSLNHDDSKKNGLTLLAIDEVHLFAQFGLYFRDEFLQLRPPVFDKLRVGGTRQSSNFYKHGTNTVHVRHCHYIHGRAFLGNVLHNNQEPLICTGSPRVVHDEISCATYGRRY